MWEAAAPTSAVSPVKRPAHLLPLAETHAHPAVNRWPEPFPSLTSMASGVAQWGRLAMYSHLLASHLLSCDFAFDRRDEAHAFMSETLWNALCPRVHVCRTYPPSVAHFSTGLARPSQISSPPPSRRVITHRRPKQTSPWSVRPRYRAFAGRTVSWHHFALFRISAHLRFREPLDPDAVQRSALPLPSVC